MNHNTLDEFNPGFAYLMILAVLCLTLSYYL